MSKQEPTTTTTRKEIMETFAALAVACGILQASQGDDDPPRTELIRALRDFAVLIRQTQAKTNTKNNAESRFAVDESASRIDSCTVEELVTIETAAAKLRKISTYFVVSQRERLTGVSEFSEELRSLCGKNTDYQSLILQSRSLIRAFRKKLFLEKVSVERVLEKLKDLYITEQQDLLELCLDLEKALEKPPAVQSPQLQGVLSVFEAWQSSKPLKQSTGSNNSIASKTSPLISHHSSATITREAKQQQDGFDSEMFSIEDIQCLKSFQFSISVRERSSATHKVLLVGKEGAGKTHMCNEIDWSVRDHVRGRSLDPITCTLATANSFSLTVSVACAVLQSTG